METIVFKCDECKQCQIYQLAGDEYPANALTSECLKKHWFNGPVPFSDFVQGAEDPWKDCKDFEHLLTPNR